MKLTFRKAFELGFKVGIGVFAGHCSYKLADIFIGLPAMMLIKRIMEKDKKEEAADDDGRETE